VSQILSKQVQVTNVFRPRTEVPFDSDEEFERVIETGEEYTSPWEDTVADDSSMNGSEDVIFSKKDTLLEPAYGESLITNMFRENMELTDPIDIPRKRRKRYPSPGEGVLSPRSTRRNMLADELTISSRQHLIWERQTRARLASLYTEPVSDDEDGEEDKTKEMSRSV
jgi:hypothetical protein